MDRLRDVRLKLDRADQHLQGLYDALNKYVTDNRERFLGELHSDPPEYIFKGESVSFRAFDALKWSPIIGDAVHNLHAVLDYLVCQLTLANGKDVCTSTGFPVFASKAHWLKTKAPGKFKDVLPAAKTVIEGLQPFNRYARLPHGDWPGTIDKSKVEVYLHTTRSVLFEPGGPGGRKQRQRRAHGCEGIRRRYGNPRAGAVPPVIDCRIRSVAVALRLSMLGLLAGE